MQKFKKNIAIDEYKQQPNIDGIAKKLQLAMHENKISAQALSCATGISVAAINNMKRGDGNPTIGTLSTIADFFHLSLADLLDIDSINDKKRAIALPIFDLRFSNQRVDSNLLEKIFLETPKNIDTRSIFGIVINNNSLLPIYEKNTIFVVSEHQKIADCDIVLICIQKNINALKRLFIKDGELYFKNITINESIEKYNKEDVDILGVVVQIIQRIV